MLFTLSDEAFGWVGREPGLAVCGLIWLLDKLKLTRDLPVIEEAQRLCLVLHELNVIKVELKERMNKEGLIRQYGKFILSIMYPLNICIRLKAQDQ